MKITIPNYKVVSWNTFYAGKHWSVRREVAQEAHDLVYDAILKDKLSFVDGPVDITIKAYLRRVIDPDNVCAKILVDGLKGKVIKNDSSQFIQSVRTMCIKSRSDYVEIYL